MKVTYVLFGILVALGALLYAGSRIFPGIVPLVMPAPELSQTNPLPFILPKGFTAHLYTKDTPDARVLTRDPRGVLVVSMPSEGKVVALPDTDQNGVADKVIPILENLNSPHGIVFRCGPLGEITDGSNDCYLFVAETDAVNVYHYDERSSSAVFSKQLIALPHDGGHSTRSLLLHPDGKRILVAVGSSCNVCHEKTDMRAAVLAVDMKTGSSTVFAKGLRNTVFMTLNPVDGKIWGTDMGRDLLGDDAPPDEVNILAEGGNYGWPICYGKNNHDTEFDKNVYIRNPCMEPFETESHIDLQAHSAPLGVAFIPEEGWPEEYRLGAFVAFHGSWNRSVPTGYKIVRIPMTEGTPGAIEDFMTGFLNTNGTVVGRPAGLLAEPGGVLYVSDDRAGAIYKIQYTP